ncbi:MAG: HigA family addiction module antitoxin [Candidatus Korobacteraceae bacterium]|jgi:addiction module HigA family antidote
MATKKVFAIHPGEILREEFMKPLGLTAYQLAKELHVSIPRVSDIVRERRAVTADTALRLGRYFGTDAQTWMNLQADYDLRIARSKANIGSVRPRKTTAA